MPTTARRRLSGFWTVVLSVVGSVLLVAVVVVLYQRGVIAFTGPLVAGALVPLILLLRVGYLTSRVRRRRGELTVLLGGLSRLVTAERELPRDLRPTRATDRSLVEVVAVVDSARTQLTANRADAVTTVGRLAELTAGWVPEAPVTEQCRRAVAAAQRLQLIWGEVQRGVGS